MIIHSALRIYVIRFYLVRPKQVMDHKEQFKKWLPNNGVKAVDSYMTYVNKTEEVLGMSVDDFFRNAIEKAIEEKFTIENFSTKKKRNDYRSMTRKYCDFIFCAWRNKS